MTARVLSRRPGIETRYHKQSDGSIIIETVQDVEPILERNKKLAVEYGKNINSRTWFPVASIPVTIQYEWLKKYGISNIFDEEYEPLIKRLLNSSDYRYLRTSEIVL